MEFSHKLSGSGHQAPRRHPILLLEAPSGATKRVLGVLVRSQKPGPSLPVNHVHADVHAKPESFPCFRLLFGIARYSITARK